MNTQERPVLDRANLPPMPKVDFSAFDNTASNCTPSNCPMFTPDTGERPVLKRDE